MSGTFEFQPIKVPWGTSFSWTFMLGAYAGSYQSGVSSFANAVQGSGRAVTDAENTMSILGFVVEDEFGNILTDASVRSVDGTSYTVLRKHPEVVPEPATAALLGLGLAVSVRRWTRRR